MNFPKPISIDASTIARYVAVFKRLVTRTTMRYPHALGSDVITNLLADLIHDRPTHRPSTFRQYKAATLWSLRNFIDTKPMTDDRKSHVQSVIDRLVSEKSTGGLRKGNRTSSKKALYCPAIDVGLVRADLDGRAGLYALAGSTLAAMEVLRLTGARPCELASLSATLTSHNRVAVHVINAKATNSRGLDATRTIDLGDLGSEDIANLLNWSSVLGALTANHSPDKVIRKLNKYFSRAARRVLTKRKKYPTLYTFRHQLAADLKAGGTSREEIAAVLGHANDVTAGRHYGRGSKGTGGRKASASPDAVLRVRRRAKAFKPSGPGALRP